MEGRPRSAHTLLIKGMSKDFMLWPTNIKSSIKDINLGITISIGFASINTSFDMPVSKVILTGMAESILTYS